MIWKKIEGKTQLITPRLLILYKKSVEMHADTYTIPIQTLNPYVLDIMTAKQVPWKMGPWCSLQCPNKKGTHALHQELLFFSNSIFSTQKKIHWSFWLKKRTTMRNIWVGRIKNFEKKVYRFSFKLNNFLYNNKTFQILYPIYTTVVQRKRYGKVADWMECHVNVHLFERERSFRSISDYS